jgi:hypothetical protein
MTMTSQQLRDRATIHRTIHANRTILLEGTSEGAAKGWETRRGGGGDTSDNPAARRYEQIAAKHEAAGNTKAAEGFRRNAALSRAKDAEARAAEKPWKYDAEGKFIPEGQRGGPRGMEQAREALIAKDRAKAAQYAKAFKVGEHDIPVTEKHAATGGRRPVPSMGPKSVYTPGKDTGKKDPRGRRIVEESGGR